MSGSSRALLCGAVAEILLVDDDRGARDTLAALLAREGYDLVFGANGRDALSRLEERPIDVLLCDVMMPQMDGFEVCRRVKAHPHWRFIPVSLITALDDGDHVVRGLDAGADDFVTKPVEGRVLRARVRALLRIRQSYVERAARTATEIASLLTARRERLMHAANLTSRERDVLELLLLGRSHADIAVVLGISQRTSKFHLSNVLAKLGAESRADLTRIFA